MENKSVLEQLKINKCDYYFEAFLTSRSMELYKKFQENYQSLDANLKQLVNNDILSILNTKEPEVSKVR